MIKVYYTRAFLRQVKKCERALLEEVLEKIDLFKDEKNHKMLKVHKLHGKLGDKYGFNVNYKIRIYYRYGTKNEAYLIALGDHDIYK